MSLPLKHATHNNNFWLSPQRTVFWDEERLLIISDLHFGKSGHFRKSGIAVPQNVYKGDMQRLMAEIQYFNPAKIVVVGDMFHSSANKELDLFLRWRESITAEIILIKGNHDILKKEWYISAGIEVHEECWQHKNIGFTHDQACIDQLKQGTDYIFTGHIHPGIELRGFARQSVKLPCFFFCAGYAVLPAFSVFTGLAIMQPCKEDSVYAILPPDNQNFSAASVIRL